MPLENRDFGILHSAYVGGGGTGNSHSAHVIAIRDSQGISHSAFLVETQQIKARLNVDMQIDKQIPDGVFGFLDPQGATFTIPNQDRAFQWLLQEPLHGRPVRLVRKDRKTGEAKELYSGVINKPTIGEAITLQCTEFDLTPLLIDMPKNRVYSSDAIPITGLGDRDVTVNYPGASGVNVPVNIVYGEMKYVPLNLINYDDGNQFYDYLVCEGLADVEEAYYQTNGKWFPKFTVEGISQNCTSTSMVLDASDNQGDTADLNGVNFYQGCFVKFLSGPMGPSDANRLCWETFEIDTYDPITKTATFVNPVPANSIGRFMHYRIQLFEVLKGTEYAGRTAIRFRRPQIQDSALQTLTAKVVVPNTTTTYPGITSFGTSRAVNGVPASGYVADAFGGEINKQGAGPWAVMAGFGASIGGDQGVLLGSNWTYDLEGTNPVYVDVLGGTRQETFFVANPESQDTSLPCNGTITGVRIQMVQRATWAEASADCRVRLILNSSPSGIEFGFLSNDVGTTKEWSGTLAITPTDKIRYELLFTVSGATASPSNFKGIVFQTQTLVTI